MIYKKIEESKGLIEIDGKQQHEFDIIRVHDGWAECGIFYRDKMVGVIDIPVDCPLGVICLISGHVIKILRRAVIK